MSSSSGAKVSPECVDAFTELKLGKKIKYVIYKLDDKMSEIVVHKKYPAEGETAPSGEELHEKFLAELPEDGCCYATYDFEYDLGGGEGKRNKIFFLSWNSDNARVKQKMVYSSSKDALKKTFNGIGQEIQGTDFSEVAHSSFLEKVGVKGSKN